MPYVNIAKILLNDYDFWEHVPTFYTRFQLDEDVYVYRFGCHFGHTNVCFKISLFEMLKQPD